MSRNDNHSRAQKAVGNWPTWKQEVSLTKHSTSLPRSSINGERTQNEDNSHQRAAEVNA